jgi:hypothetical protein
MSYQDVQGKSRFPMFQEPCSETCMNQEVQGTSSISSNDNAGYSGEVPGSRRPMNQVQEFTGIRKSREQGSILVSRSSRRGPGGSISRVWEVPVYRTLSGIGS